MKPTPITSSRKKFLLWTAGLFASLSVLRIAGAKKTEQAGKSQSMKMLTQDGKLVEVDMDKLACGKRKKISDDQLKNWVTRK